MWRRDRRPEVRPPHVWTLPRPHRVSLDNGVRVVAFDRPGQHIISASLVLDIPLTAEPLDIEGVASLTHRSLDEGTTSHPGSTFAEALEDLGADLSGGVSHSASHLHIDVPGPGLRPALVLLAEAVLEPTLAATDIDRHRDLRLAQIAQTLANSAQRASLEFRRAVIGRKFRAARMAGGRAETVSTISREDVVEFHRRTYRPEGATLVLAGDFSNDPISLAEEALGTWASDSTEDLTHEVPQARRPHCRLAHRPGAVQADVRLGGYGIDRTDPRWADLQVGAHAMGGAFLSRLNRVLREEKGYTYGIHLASQPMRDGGFLTVQGSFRTEVAVEAISLATSLLDLTEAPITAGEVDDAVHNLIGLLPLRFATAGGLVDQVATLVANGLSSEFINSYSQALQHVTPESATLALESLLRPGQYSLVVVGDADVLASQLAAAGWEVELVDRVA